jgi:hypothetical protein
MKKLFNARLVLYVIALLCLFAVPSHASAETSTLAEGKSGDLSWKIYERNETTTIEITGDGDYSFDEDGYPTWKDDMRNLGVTYAKVDVTGITTMKNMFEGCDELSEINFCYSDTSNVTDMSGMMQGCERISEFQGTVLDTSNVTNMSYMFSDCNFYCELNLSYFNTSKVEDMSGMFSQCETVSEESKIKIGRWDTSNVKDMSGMFSGCTAELELQSND